MASIQSSIRSGNVTVNMEAEQACRSAYVTVRITLHDVLVGGEFTAKVSVPVRSVSISNFIQMGCTSPRMAIKDALEQLAEIRDWIYIDGDVVVLRGDLGTVSATFVE